jgi:hypothetical protein
MPNTASVIASIRAMLDTGTMSPKPTVLRVMKLKYKALNPSILW